MDDEPEKGQFLLFGYFFGSVSFVFATLGSASFVLLLSGLVSLFCYFGVCSFVGYFQVSFFCWLL